MKNFNLYVGIDVSKGKADAAILQVSELRSVKPKFLRKKLSFKFVKSEVLSFLETIRKYSLDSNCIHTYFSLEVTGIYSINVYNFIKENCLNNEEIHQLNTDFVSKWRESHNIPKSDPLDAQTICSIIGTDDNVKYVSDNVFENKKGYQDLKTLIHRHFQIKKLHSQEINRLIAQCDCYFPELQYVFEPNSAAFLAILSSYPTTHDIINASKDEVFYVAYQATKHRCSIDKIDKLFEYCNDTLVPHVSDHIKLIIIDIVENIKSIRTQIKALEKEIKLLASTFPQYNLLLSLTGCGPITAATIIAETGNIDRFKNADHFVSYSGSSPRIKRSGTSVEIMGKISKKGSKYLRHALYMIAEFGRRHNPILKHLFERVKNGNKKRHKLAVIAVANRIARYCYSIMKNHSTFIITYESLMRLPEETRNTFFQTISLDFSNNTRKQVYHYSDCNGEVHPFVYIKDPTELVI
ncbi:IS110 family transposase [Faecalibacillus faecis]|uniref:IS110 family transposase n=1 Tax=Faecalibacillus faecis TaxID=1982628 RepID=UPI003863C535